MSGRKTLCTRGLKNGRIAFYSHYYDPSKPMLWSYGTFSGVFAAYEVHGHATLGKSSEIAMTSR